ncbi:unnamed protein product [Closterium sp. NIES-54]
MQCVCVPCLGISIFCSRYFPRQAGPPVPFPTASLASPLTHLGGSFTTPPRVVFCPLRTSRLTSRYLTTISFPTALPFPPPPPPLFLAPVAPSVDPLPPQCPAPLDVSQVDPVEPVEVAVDSVAATGAEPAGAGPGGAEPGFAESEGAEPGGAEPERVESGGAEPGGAESGGAEPERVEPGGAESGGAEPGGAKSGGPPGVPSRRKPLSPQRLREWYARRCSHAAGATWPAAGGASEAGAAGGAAGARAAGAAGPRGAGAGGTVAVGGPAGVGAAGASGPGGAHTEGTGAAGAGGAAGVGAVGAGAVAPGGAAGAGAAGGTGAGGAAGVVAGDPGAEGTGAVSAVSGGAAWPRPYYIPLLQQALCLPPSPGPTPPLLSPQPVQSQSQLLPASPVLGPSPYSGPTRGLTERREPETRPASPESRPESPVCARVPLLSPPASSLPDGPDPESDSLRSASPTVTRFLSTVVTDTSSTASTLVAVAALVDFAAACRVDYATSLVVESDSASTAMDTAMASWKSTGTYVDEVPPPGANIVSGMWIFRVKRPPGSPPVFKARYVARGFSQRQGVDFFQTFSPTQKMTTLRMLLHVAAQRNYELHSLDFSTAFLQGSLHEEIRLRRPPGFTESFPADASWVDDLATQRSSQGYTFSLGSSSVSWRSTRSSSILSSSCEAGIYAGAMAAEELRRLTYLPTNLGEPPRSRPVLYVDNKAMIAWCQEHRLEHRKKHMIALCQGHERYFLLVVDDYSRHTTVFPLRRKGEGIRQTFRLPASPQQNGIAERRIGMVMDVARTSMIHAAAPHFLWPFAVQYAAHQINLRPRVSLPETTPTLRWTGKIGDASVFRVWGSKSFVRDTSADKLVLPCLSLRAPPVDPLPPQGPAPSGVSQVDHVEPVEVAVDTGAARGVEPAGAGPGGAEPGFAESGGAERGGAEPEREEPWGAEPGGAMSGV